MVIFANALLLLHDTVIIVISKRIKGLRSIATKRTKRTKIWITSESAHVDAISCKGRKCGEVALIEDV